MERYLHCVTCLCVWWSIWHRNNLTFFPLCKIFTWNINRVKIHIVSLHLLDQICEENIHKNFPHLWMLNPSTKIFQQKSCPLMIQVLDLDFWTSSGTQHQEGNGSYIVSYIDDGDDDVKANMIPIIIGVTGIIKRSFRKYLNNIPGKH